MSMSAVVPYSCTNKAFSVLENVPRALMESARPGLVEARAGMDRAQLVRVSNALTQAVMITTGLFACVVVGVNRGLRFGGLGAEQYGGSLLSAVYGAGARRPALVGDGDVHRLRLRARLPEHAQPPPGRLRHRGGLGNGAPPALRLPRAPHRDMVGSLFVSLPVTLYAVARDVGGSALSFVTPVLHWGWRFALCFAAALYLAERYTPTTLLSLIVTSTAASLAYIGVMFPLAMRSSLKPYLARGSSPFAKRSPGSSRAQFPCIDFGEEGREGGRSMRALHPFPARREGAWGRRRVRASSCPTRRRSGSRS